MAILKPTLFRSLKDILTASFTAGRNWIPISSFSASGKSPVANGRGASPYRNLSVSEISNFPLLKETSLTVSHHHFHFMHGHHLDKNNLLANTYYFVGHTHVYSLDGQILNPGSISLPKENPEHTCFIYQDNTISLISLTDFHIIKERKLNE